MGAVLLPLLLSTYNSCLCECVWQLFKLFWFIIAICALAMKRACSYILGHYHIFTDKHMLETCLNYNFSHFVFGHGLAIFINTSLNSSTQKNSSQWLPDFVSYLVVHFLYCLHTYSHVKKIMRRRGKKGENEIKKSLSHSMYTFTSVNVIRRQNRLVGADWLCVKHCNSDPLQCLRNFAVRRSLLSFGK